MENSPWNYMSIEIVEKILLDVPTSDMVYNKPWVYKTWTNVILQPSFWIRKLKKMGITVDEEIKSVLAGFEKYIQVACLYHTCLNEEHTIMKNKNDVLYFLNECPIELGCGALLLISDDFSEMLKVAGSLVTKTAMSVELSLEKENIPVLPLLLKLLAVRESQVSIRDYYSFWNFSPRNLQFLKGSKGEANLDNFIGCVSTLEGLILNTKDMKVAIAADENNVAIDRGLRNTFCRISAVYIKAGTNVSKLDSLTSVFFTLIITGLESTHIMWMNDVFETLLPGGRIFKLILLNYKLNKASSEELLRSMSINSFIPYIILCASSNLTQADAQSLNELSADLNTLIDAKLKSMELDRNTTFVCYERDEQLTELEVWF